MTPERRDRALFAASTAFAISTTTLQVVLFYLNKDNKWALILTIAVVLLVVLAYLNVWRITIQSARLGLPRKLKNKLKNQNRNRGQLTYRIGDDIDVLRVFGIAKEHYNVEAMDRNQMIDRHRAYPHGLHLIEIDEEIVAFMTLWPLKADAFHGLVDGKFGDLLMDGSRVIPQMEAATCSTWYCMSYVSLPTAVRVEATSMLLASAFDHIVRSFKGDGGIRIALALERPHEAEIIRTLGFSNIHQNSADRLPLYVYHKPDTQHLKSIVDVLSAKNSESPSSGEAADMSSSRKNQAQFFDIVFGIAFEKISAASP